MKPDAELDDKTRDAVERCLERISEAAKKLGPRIEERQPQVSWRGITRAKSAPGATRRATAAHRTA